MERLKVAFAILFEVVPVDDDRRRGLPFPVFLFFRVVVRIGVVDDEHQTLRVGRPREFGDAALDVRKLLSLTARAVQQPDLRTLFLLRVIAARAEERERPIVRAPQV